MFYVLLAVASYSIDMNIKLIVQRIEKEKACEEESDREDQYQNVKTYPYKLVKGNKL